MPVLVGRRQRMLAARFSRRAFSMLELLVVLAILAALTTVAVQSLEPVAEQSRAVASKRTLEEIKKAIIDVRQADDATHLSGLVADTSLLPDLTSGPNFYNCLAIGVGMPEAATYSFNGLTAVYGWRGPYLQPSASSGNHFVDGWNRPLGWVVQDVGGATKPSFTALTDRLIITNAASAMNSEQVVSTSITGNMLSATQLTVNLYGLDLNGNRITLTGPASPLSALPQVFLQGGLDPVTKAVTTMTGAVTAAGTNCGCQFTPPFPQMLVGNRTLSVITPALTETADTHYQIYSPLKQMNLLPGTSPIVELLVVRQTSTVGSGGDDPMP